MFTLRVQIWHKVLKQQKKYARHLERLQLVNAPHVSDLRPFRLVMRALKINLDLGDQNHSMWTS